MAMIPKHHITLSCYLLLCTVLLFGQATVSSAQTSETADASGTEQEQLETIAPPTETFEYQVEGRLDPFQPFVTERATRPTEDLDALVESDEQLTGMQLFEPGQLTLVALMVAGQDKYAMVQDFTGKGYIIREGMKIGRRGVVSDIVDNKVIITETATTRGGKVLTNEIAMVLKQEGEE